MALLAAKETFPPRGRGTAASQAQRRPLPAALPCPRMQGPRLPSTLVGRTQEGSPDGAAGRPPRKNRARARPLATPHRTWRYSQFYTDEEFCHYNMFNHHFFGGEEAREICINFLQLDNGEGVIMVTDPPFGGLVEPLAHSFKKLVAMWRLEPDEGTSKELPIFWIFPYFFEPRILSVFPSFSMLDYQVDYDNHAQYKHGKTGRKQSPVRIFTNIPQNMITLPKEEGYRYCSICQRYVSSDNQHCEICNMCTSKDGRRWKHCILCRKCVKPSWIHCSSCNRCALQSHPCGSTKDGCFICGKSDHKQRNCPRRYIKDKTTQVKLNPGKNKRKIKISKLKGKSIKHTAVSNKKRKKSKTKTPS